MAEEITLQEEFASQLATTSANLETAKMGSEERVNEAKIYKEQAELIIKQQDSLLKEERDNAELALKREEMEARLAIEESKAKTEKRTLWAKVGLGAGQAVLYTFLGWLYLKSNLKYGSMVGKDSKEIFNEIKKIRI